MRPEQHDRRRETEGGIPDGLLVGVLAFLLGVTLLVWSATGLAGWIARDTWPDGVTFGHTPFAMRHLVANPRDVPGAWPGTPPDQLSGYGLFWGLFIGQLMVLLVLTVFVMGTVARWRAVRVGRQSERGSGRQANKTEPRDTVRRPEPPDAVRPPGPPYLAPDRLPQEPDHAHAPNHVGPSVPSALAALEVEIAGALTKPSAAPLSTERTPVSVPAPRGPVVLGPPETRYPLAAQALSEARGPALVITSNPSLWAETKDARAKLGPVLLYDPSHLCETPARLHWAPSRGCEDKATAAARAAAILTPVRPTATIDQELADTAETLLHCYLHAAAVDGRTIRHIHRWAQGMQVQEAVRALRKNPKAAPGIAGELESALTSHPERRDMAQELTTRALSSLSTINVRESCTPNRTDSLALDSFLNEEGTLYVVGKPIEDPRYAPGAMPLLTALTASVVERGRRMAERSSSGRLDPPLTLVLDDVAAVAPLPQLPDLLADGVDRGMPTLALMRSREQGRSRWPQYELPV